MSGVFDPNTYIKTVTIVGCGGTGVQVARIVGRTAYDLLAASDFLVQAAVQLLMHGNEAYIREKLQSGLQRITGAFHEGIRHSERPELFDFSEMDFPQKTS